MNSASLPGRGNRLWRNIPFSLWNNRAEIAERRQVLTALQRQIFLLSSDQVQAEGRHCVGTFPYFSSGRIICDLWKSFSVEITCRRTQA
jgi:hypothetical protein